MAKDLEQRWQEIEDKRAPTLLVRLTRKYVVWIESPCEVRWEWVDDFEFAEEPKLREVLGRAAEVIAIPAIGPNEEQRLSFKKMVGQAIAAGLEGQFDVALRLLTSAERYEGETAMMRRWEEISGKENPKHLILQSDKMLVWIDHEYDVDWEAVDGYRPKDEKRWEEVLTRAGAVECIPSDHLDRERRVDFKRMVGEGIARGLAGHYENALQMLDDAENYVQARNREASRKWYLGASMVTTVAMVALGAVAWLARMWTIGIVGHLVFFLFLSALAGSLGAQLSIIMRMGRMDLDPAAGRCPHYLEAISRIVAGMLCAALAGLAVYAEILSPVLVKGANRCVILVLVGFVAGASERLASSIISQVAGSSQDKPKKSATQGPPTVPSTGGKDNDKKGFDHHESR